MPPEFDEWHVNESEQKGYTHTAIESRKLLKHTCKEDGVGGTSRLNLARVRVRVKRGNLMMSTKSRDRRMMKTEVGE
jgi:hypothetical protein